MQGQRNEQEWAGGGQGDDLASSPHAALLGTLEAARVALVELSARVVFVELVEPYPLHEPRLELRVVNAAGCGDDSNARKMAAPCASMADERRDDEGVCGGAWPASKSAELVASALERQRKTPAGGFGPCRQTR